MITLFYDSTFEGYLTAVFEVYDKQYKDVLIRKQSLGEASLWGNHDTIETDTEKSNRVWEGLKKSTSESTARNFYCSYLSELQEVEDNMLGFLRHVFASKQDVGEDYGNPFVLQVKKVAKMVGREKHRMEAFVRFQLLESQIWYAPIEPDFNVLPLISKHFNSRYADQRWMIADLKRGYGLYYDLNEVEIIPLEDFKNFHLLSDAEVAYQNLWKTYFESTNIAERRNLKLHLQHVPTRYWKYLSEKKP